MPEMTSYRHGTPNWVDVSSTDLSKTTAFYSALFGWTALELGPDTGGYGFFQKNGKNVAGFAPTMQPEVPPSWSTYIAVTDVDAASTAAATSGGMVVAGPMDLPNDSGRMVLVVDPAGAFFGMHQAGPTHAGASLVNEENTVVWNELMSRDLAKSLAFLQAVVGDESEAIDPEASYFMIKAGGRNVGGAMAMGADFPAEVPSHWQTYFLVSDADAIAERTAALGGSVVVPPTDMPVGRFAILTDPVGASFAVIRSEQVDDPNG